MVILVLFIYMSGFFFVSDFFSFYYPIGKDPFCVRVDINLCKFGACFHHLRRLIQISMLLQ